MIAIVVLCAKIGAFIAKMSENTQKYEQIKLQNVSS
jgi:hypothetical protein